jgi:hypothetical protein
MTLEQPFLWCLGRHPALPGQDSEHFTGAGEVVTPCSAPQVTGFGYEHDAPWLANMAMFKEFTDVAQGVRRLGAASVDLCHVALGAPPTGCWVLGTGLSSAGQWAQGAARPVQAWHCALGTGPHSFVPCGGRRVLGGVHCAEGCCLGMGACWYGRLHCSSVYGRASGGCHVQMAAIHDTACDNRHRSLAVYHAVACRLRRAVAPHASAVLRGTTTPFFPKTECPALPHIMPHWKLRGPRSTTRQGGGALGGPAAAPTADYQPCSNHTSRPTSCCHVMLRACKGALRGVQGCLQGHAPCVHRARATNPSYWHILNPDP